MSDQTTGRLGVGQKLFVGIQYFLPQHFLTRLVAWFMSRETAWLKNTQIRMFNKLFSVNTDEAAKPVPDGYRSLNDYFTRELKPDSRRVDPTEGVVVSPCDGVISECGRIDDSKLLQAKGFRYRVADLLGDENAAERFTDGHFMTIYLAPYDYHRVHFPVAGTITEERHIPGKLFSVNGATAAAVPRLFARNERRIFRIDSASVPATLVMVGALNVGSISTVWEQAPLMAGSVDVPTRLPAPGVAFQRGDTLGWFNMGSTVILLLESSAPEWRDTLAPGVAVRYGERLSIAP